MKRQLQYLKWGGWLCLITMITVLVCTIGRRALEIPRHQESCRKLVSEIQQLRQHKPQPTVENNRRLTQDLAQCDQTYRDLVNRTQPIALPFLSGTDAANEVDFYFLVMAYNRFFEQYAKQMKVRLSENCLLGFEEYAFKGAIPPSDALEKLREQCVIAAKVLFLLFSANDYDMEFHKIVRSNVPNYSKKVKSYRLSLEFSTYTQAFRNFFRSIQDHGLPVLWREISVHANSTDSEAVVCSELVYVKLGFDWIVPRHYPGGVP